jgi:DinB superfamily
MELNLEQTIALLERTPAGLDALLRGLPESWTSTNEGGSTWCAVDIVGHLIHGERADWIPRARMILDLGETSTFEPFDRGGHARETEGKQLEALLDEFRKVRAESLRQLKALNLRSEDLERRGNHPAFGAVTLSQLLATWAAHDLTHLHQISRVMAYQYRDLVGPWRAYLGALHCNGHGS